MKTMTPRERVIASLERRPVDRIPWVELSVDHPIMFQTAALMGHPEALEALKKMQAEVSMAGSAREYLNTLMRAEHKASRLTGRANVSLMNSLMCFDNYTVYLLDPNHPEQGIAADGVIKSAEDLKKVKLQSVDMILEDAEAFLKNRGEEAACAEMYLGIDPVWHSIGFMDFCMDLIEEPEFVEEFMDIVTERQARLAEALCQMDFDFIWAADDMAYHSSPFFSDELYREHLLPYTKRVAEKITKPWIFHSDGNLTPLFDSLISQGMNGIHPIEARSMDREMVRDKYKDRITFVGGVELAALQAGTVEESRATAHEMIDMFKGKASYMFCSSNSIMPGVKPENLKAALEVLEECG